MWISDVAASSSRTVSNDPNIEAKARRCDWPVLEPAGGNSPHRGSRFALT
jgi:hypothetical protein